VGFSEDATALLVIVFLPIILSLLLIGHWGD
jgi:hypothetical protein